MNLMTAVISVHLGFITISQAEDPDSVSLQARSAHYVAIIGSGTLTPPSANVRTALVQQA